MNVDNILLDALKAYMGLRNCSLEHIEPPTVKESCRVEFSNGSKISIMPDLTAVYYGLDGKTYKIILH